MSDMSSVLSVLSKPKRRKQKRRGFQGKVDLQRLLKSKTINKTDKETYTEMLAAAYPAFEKEVKKYFDGNSKIIDDRQTLVELLTDKKFAKALCEVMKEQDELSKIIYFAISDLYVSQNKAFNESGKTVKRYLEVFTKFNKKQIGKLAESLKISKIEALSLQLSSISFKEARMKVMRNKYQSFINQLYGFENLSEKKAIRAIRTCFPNKSYQFISFALGERQRNNPEQRENFSILTNAILNMLEHMDKDDRKEILKSFAKNRMKNPNAIKIRINLMAISEEEYKGITRTVQKLVSTGMSRELFV